MLLVIVELFSGEKESYFRIAGDPEILSQEGKEAHFRGQFLWQLSLWDSSSVTWAPPSRPYLIMWLPNCNGWKQAILFGSKE